MSIIVYSIIRPTLTGQIYDKVVRICILCTYAYYAHDAYLHMHVYMHMQSNPHAFLHIQTLHI